MAGLFDDLLATPPAGASPEGQSAGGPLRLTVNPKHRDMVIRTVLGEAAGEPDEGQRAVAAVIQNRLNAGQWGGSIPEVVLAKNQFEPWNTQSGRSRMFGYGPTSEAYQRAAGNVDAILAGEAPDPTGGATHFLEPNIVRRRNPYPTANGLPNWAQGEPTAVIGNHHFYPSDISAQSRSVPQPAAPAAPPTATTGLFDDLLATPPPSPVADRFGAMQAPAANAPALQAGLRTAATEMTRGPAVPPSTQLATDFMNQGAAAGQGTTPNVAAHQPNLISNEVHQDELGNVLYRDRATGQMVPTDKNKHVVLRDPVDQTPKVFARTSDGITATDEGRLSAAGRILGTGLATGAPTARPSIPEVTRQVVRGPVPSADQLKQIARVEGYKSPEVAALQVRPEALQRIARTIEDTLSADFDEVMSPKTYALLRKGLEAPEGSFVTGQNYESLRKKLGKLLKSPDGEEREAARAAIGQLDDAFIGLQKADVLAGDPETTARLLKEARANWGAAKRSERVTGAEERALDRAGATGSGANVDNASRQHLDRILAAEAKRPGSSGLNKAEIAEVRAIVRGEPVGNAARLLGKLAPTGIVSAGGGAGLGFLMGGAAGGFALPAVGMVSKMLGDSMTATKIARLDELVRSRSPAAKALESSSTKWARSFEDLSANPNGSKLAAFMLASRNLANTFNGAGIKVTTSDLIKAMQGPVRSAAEDEQPKPERVLD
jgi:hypothetical protein